MFATVMLGQAGLFLAIPILFTLLCLLVGIMDAGRTGRPSRSASWRAGMATAGPAYCAVTPKWPWSRPP